MINVVDLWHHYGVRPILKGLSMHVSAGELIAVMGPNGMGKTTLMSLIAGVLCPIKGKIEIDGRPRRQSIEEEIEIRKKVIFLPDTPYLPLQNTGREFILAMGLLYQVDSLRLMEHIDRLLPMFDMSEIADSPIKSYSAGQKKKIGLCSALVTEAPIMILDEPFSGGLDSAGLLAMSRVLKNLAERKDITVVMAVPVPELVEPLADKIAIIHQGELLAYDSPDGLRQLTNSEGPLTEVLEKLIHPKTFENIDRYLEGRKS